MPTEYVEHGFGGSVTANADGRLEVFGVNAEGQLFTIFQHAVGAGWSDFSPFPLPPGVRAKGRVAVASHPDGRLQIAFLADNGAIYTTGQREDGPGWREVQEVGQGGNRFASPPVITRTTDGRIEMFAVATDGQLLHVWNSSWPGFSFAFGPWLPMGSHLLSTDPDGAIAIMAAQVQGVDGPELAPPEVVLFARSSTGELLRYEQRPNDEGWEAEEPIVGAPAGRPTAARVHVWYTNRRLPGTDHDTAFFRTATGELRRSTLVHATGSTVDLALDPGPIDGNPVVAVNADGRMEVFFRAGDGSVRHFFQPTLFAPPMGPFDLGGTCAVDPVVAKNDDGRLEIFCIGIDGVLHHNYQLHPNGSWSTWTSLGGSLVS